MASDDIPGFEPDPDLEKLLGTPLDELDEDTRIDLQLYKSRMLQAKRDAGMSQARPAWWPEGAPAPERMGESGGEVPAGAGEGGESAAGPDETGEDEAGEAEEEPEATPSGEPEQPAEEAPEEPSGEAPGEGEEAADEEPADAEPESAGGSEPEGTHGGRFPRHTGPPPGEIPGFDADPELEELLGRDVLEIEDEDTRQEVQLYRARKMKAARDAGMGTAGAAEEAPGTEETAEAVETDGEVEDEAAEDEEKELKKAPPPEEGGPYRGERKIGDLVSSRTGGREVTRRGFISTFGLGMAGMLAAFSAGGIGSLRYFFPNVLSNPPEQFVAGDPAEYAPGTVSTKFKDQYRVWLVNLSDRIVAIQAICTHLGCTPNWLDSQGIFKCPCHGSAYYRTGVNFAGPAPRPMARVGVRLNPQGKIIVDKSQVFNRGTPPGWNASNAFIEV